jgi:hypothetical protein
MTATAVAGVALSAAFLLARYGNEDFEQMRPADVAAAQEMYRVAPAGASLFALSESVPWRDHDLERYVYAYAAPPPLTRGELPKLLEQMRAAPGGAYLLLTDGQWSEIHYLGGVPADRVEAAQEMYRTAPELRRIYGDGDVGLYVLADPAP